MKITGRILFSLALTVLLLMACFADVSAAEDPGKDGTVYKTMTLTEQEVVSSLRCKSKAELKEMGLTERQIKHIMSCDIKSLKGRLSYSIGYRCFVSIKVRETNGFEKYWVTYITTVAKWKWIKQPTCAYTDIFGVTTSDKFVKDAVKGTITYHIAGDRTRKK